jgi:hypothetical protein
VVLVFEDIIKMCLKEVWCGLVWPVVSVVQGFREHSWELSLCMQGEDFVSASQTDLLCSLHRIYKGSTFIR